MMTTTTAPPWLRRSDQAVSWARTMLQPHYAVVIDCETTDLPGAITGKVGYSNLPNREPNWVGPTSQEALSAKDSRRALRDVNGTEKPSPP